MCCSECESGVLTSPWVWGSCDQGGKRAGAIAELVGIGAPGGQPRAGFNMSRPEPLYLCGQSQVMCRGCCLVVSGSFGHRKL